MRQSQLFTKTIKEIPKGEKSVNAVLLQRGGFIHKEMAGVYTFLPLGVRVLRKIENIIREEMENISAQEVLMSVLQPKELWQRTNRWAEGIGEVMYKCKQGDTEIGLGPTHEEMLTAIVKNYVKSYEDLPFAIFQIQTKFRKELRAKSGILRGREFGMKDLYSFHTSEDNFKKYYEKVKHAYLNVFSRCRLRAVITEASGGTFSKEFSHEFQVLAKSGEDMIIYCPKLHFSQNKEIAKLKEGNNCPICKRILKEGKAIEVGNIFTLGTKYSEALGAFFQDKKSEKKPIIMGCYGIGSGRLMGTIVEVFHDENGIIWPQTVAPFVVHLLSLKRGKREIDVKIRQTCEKIYKEGQKKGVEILYDDREDRSAGEKFADADLIGIPWRVVVSEKTLMKNSTEVKQRDKNKVKLIKIGELLNLPKGLKIK